MSSKGPEATHTTSTIHEPHTLDLSQLDVARPTPKTDTPLVHTAAPEISPLGLASFTATTQETRKEHLATNQATSSKQIDPLEKVNAKNNRPSLQSTPASESGLTILDRAIRWIEVRIKQFVDRCIYALQEKAAPVILIFKKKKRGLTAEEEALLLHSPTATELISPEELIAQSEAELDAQQVKASEKQDGEIIKLG
jgi:hypothetical protein